LLEGTVVRLRIAFSQQATHALFAMGWIVAALGLLLSFWGIATFHRAHTSMFPYATANALVQGGPYRFTRNPMYIGATVSYTGVAIAMNVLWPILLVPVVLWLLSRFVIQVEERYLGERFGDAYADYRRRVRRWM